jgi:integrase
VIIDDHHSTPYEAPYEQPFLGGTALSFKFTELAIKSLQPEIKQKDYRDSLVTGLILRVSPGGTKTFRFWYRFNGKANSITLGRFGVLTLAEARNKAKRAIARVAEGEDPSVPSGSTGSGPTFEWLVTEFIKRYAKPNTSSWRETERLLRREFSPHWAKLSINSIGKANVVKILNGIVDRGSPSAANHAFSAASKLFNWAVEQGHLSQSPMFGLKKPTKAKSRERTLSDDELRKVWNAAETMGYPYGTIVQLLILTAQRRAQVSGMRWDELDLKAKTWTLTGERMKTGHKHVLPLTNRVISILEGIPRTDDRLVFPAVSGDNSVSGFSKWKRQIDRQSGVTDWTIHDLRRTAATGMAQLSVPPHVVEKILHHTSGSTAGVAGIYNRYGYLAEMREALEEWESQFFS